MDLSRLVFSFFNAEVAARYWPDIVQGFWVTTWLGLEVIATGLTVGLALALARSFQFKPASVLIMIFADAFRDRKSTRLNSSHSRRSRMPSSA